MSVHFVSSLRSVTVDPRSSLLIYDQRLLQKHGSWIRRFPHRYGVKSGEKLKDLRAFPKHVEALFACWPSQKLSDVRVVAFGGGSVGDFAGFFASIAKRGVSVIQIPSTWLAAVDSAHGGKTALNVKGAKNQVGTFHQAERVWIVKEVLAALPRQRLVESFGEIIKIGLLNAKVWRRLRQSSLELDGIWRLMPDLVNAKLQIVRRDPFEKKGIRSLLNLGHSVGHAFETKLGIAHGEAIALGTRFALMWSEKICGLNPILWKDLAAFENVGLFPNQKTHMKALERLLGTPGEEKLQDLLAQDKKAAGRGKIRFIFLRRVGYPLIKTVSIDDIRSESQRQRRYLVSLSRGH